MTAPERRLVVSADDFGASPEINHAVALAHRNGILTACGLMVAAPCAREAVQIAQTMPSLDVGLHLTLSDGRPCLPRSELSHFSGADGRFPSSATAVAIRLSLDGRARAQCAAEIEAQFSAFEATRLLRTHWDGHQHIHLHPFAWRTATRHALAAGCRWVRLPNEPWRPTSMQGFALRRTEHVLLRAMARWARTDAARTGLRVADHVFGQVESGRMTERSWLGLLAALPQGVTEVYCHPGSIYELRQRRFASGDGSELEALLSTRVRQAMNAAGARLVSFGMADAEQGAGGTR
ncbi:MAG: hopanoid biosynthesis-associated protein HpnK [Armatimonadetes bacterium]|nr:hopanoid biosynthesis-associated protein HpnK [Armatimonadota bacterium]